MKTICPHGYHHKGFVALMHLAIGHMMYIMCPIAPVATSCAQLHQVYIDFILTFIKYRHKILLYFDSLRIFYGLILVRGRFVKS